MRTSMKPDEAFGMIFDLEGTASWMNLITLQSAYCMRTQSSSV